MYKEIAKKIIILKNVPEKKSKKKWTEVKHASIILLSRSGTASEAVGPARSTYHNLSVVLLPPANEVCGR